VRKQAQKILDSGGVIKSVANAFIEIEAHIHVLAVYDFSVFDLLCAALSAECTEGGNSAEVIKMVLNGPDAERTHGGEIYASVEGTEFKEKTRCQTEIIKTADKPYHKFKNHSRCGGENARSIVYI